MNYFVHSQNQFDQNNNPTKLFLKAQSALDSKDQVQSFRALACKELRDYVYATYSNESTTKTSNSEFDSNDSKETIYDPERVDRLLVKISSLKKMNTTIMEEIFFNDAIGNVQIDSIIPSILGSDIEESGQEQENSNTSTNSKTTS